MSTTNSIVQTGDLHVAVYDLTKGIVYVANAKDNESGPTYAYDRSETTASVHVLLSVIHSHKHSY